MEIKEHLPFMYWFEGRGAKNKNVFFFGAMPIQALCANRRHQKPVRRVPLLCPDS